MKKLSVSQKINKIDSSKDYDSLHLDWLPPVCMTDYYFVSYSHLDYKKVFRDIYSLQSNEVNPLRIWYDRELRAGKDWEIEARQHIYNYNCKGVIFYISENSVASDAIHKEIEFVRKSGKAFLSINLPIENVHNHEGEYVSAASLLGLVSPDLPQIETKSRILNEFFNDKIIFLKYQDSLDKKISSIVHGLASPPLFQISYYQDKAIIDGINDLNIIQLKENDFINWDLKTKRSVPIASISDCAFANCKWLESVELPSSIKIIGDYAFYNCSSLMGIDLSDIESIGDYAFFNCSNLRAVVLPKELFIIGKGTFMECANLAKIDLPQTIGLIDESAFYGCSGLCSISLPPKLETISAETFGWCLNLTEIDIPDNVNYIGFGAFRYCQKIRSVVLGDNVLNVEAEAFQFCTSLEKIHIGCGIEKLDKCVLEGCKNLKVINMSKSIKIIDSEAFKDCVSLTKIIFDGTMADWKSIKKEKNWRANTPKISIYCNNGLIE